MPQTVTKNQTRVGVGVMILKDGKVLMSHRKGSHGAGELAFPGGHLEYMESFEDCARREVKEECGIEIKNIKFLYLANIKRYEPKHFVHTTFIAEWESGEPRALEPDRSDEWKWYDPKKLPDEPMFYTCELAFEAYRTGQTYLIDESR